MKCASKDRQEHQEQHIQESRKMGLKMQGHHHMVAVSLNDQQLGTKRKYTAYVPRKNQGKYLALWIIAFGFVAVHVYRCIDAGHQQRIQEGLVSMCDQRARMLQDQFSVCVNHVHALAVLVSTFHYYKNPSVIDQETFAEYTARTAFERPLMSGVAYAQRVLDSQRIDFESQHGGTIRTMANKEPSPHRDEYAPVIFSQETVSYLDLVDMMSGEEDRENILRARSTGKAVLTGPFNLLGSHHLGVVLTIPVYKSKLPPNASVRDRIEATVGYLGGAFDVESLVENLLGQLAGNQEIIVKVYDVTNMSDPLIMYGRQAQYGDLSRVWISPLDFGDPFRKHQMTCRYLHKAPISWTAMATAFLGYVIVFLAGYMFYTGAIHIVQVEDDFHKMERLKVLAEAADVTKSQFLATVSHEIRTPMNGILGMLALLLDTDLSSTQRDYAQTAQACGRALIALINEVLDRAKIEAGKMELEDVPFGLRSIIDDVLSLFSEKSRNKGLELAVFVSDKVPQIVMGDPGRFRQVITNLVGNSVKFTAQGHIFVQVHLAEHSKAVQDAKPDSCLNGRSNCCNFKTLSGREAADDRNNWDKFKHLIADEEFPFQVLTSDGSSQNVSLMVSVEDTGTGIPLHAQKLMFMPFMQADSSTSRRYGGTGIGLSISKCLVELMGGQISFISRPQIGSTFSFTANFKRCEKNLVTDLKRSLYDDLPTAFKGLKATVVDTKPIRAAVTRYHLKRLGVLVEVVTSIRTAVLVLGSGQPDMVLVEKDVWLSSDDLSSIRAFVPALKSPKMILLATNITGDEFDKAKAAGFSDTLIMKPLRASMVAACLHQVFGTGKKAEQGRVMANGSVFRGLLCGKKILVVDDNRVNLRVAAGALKKFGAEVECAASGKAALELLQIPHGFDACFMDIQMPEMDGFEATRQIRLMESQTNEQQMIGSIDGSRDTRTTSHWHLPVLAMTADVIHATFEVCQKSGMDGYVSKPFQEENLYQAVAKFFESKPSTIM
ncbi:hypothetical protein E3N88_40433 [Mikania micrantha]|uniref:histidine kinase n=1 Tax=Mikania micrantha TaxID=192012 RepID=A0A5N6LMN5_9ASTR|nr:hypothetical protein E3N88_40433 [Mikania micrantha]